MPASGRKRLRLAAAPVRRTVAIRTLGTFDVFRDGTPVPLAAWQSKKSRDALKMLIAHRGRPVHREALTELLWPGASAGETASRFSVVLSRARSVFDPDWTFSQDYYLKTSDDAVLIDLANVDVDVERFLAFASAGLGIVRRGDRSSAEPTLRAAYDLYGGDFLEEDAYEEWSMPLREEARASFFAVAKTLGDLAVERRECDEAVGYYVRVLGMDPYAEDAHLGLVAAALSCGRHGEARRYYRAYVARMAELDIEPAPFPAS
jgi:DNA-binding SARP family transcriptional activator